ncbi:hypothetical protein [Shewanella sp. MR-4]|uniref:hypothetical protein n=1 Tax=Shewanella sp. (strain MR-4) TaxID=60480 RepID=UPI0012EE05B5|nr:hypothetical protein [Shewanella sp. MR-4]
MFKISEFLSNGVLRMGYFVASGNGTSQLPAAGSRTVTPVTRCKYIPVSSAKTSMF